jgi:hypothetical protein
MADYEAQPGSFPLPIVVALIVAALGTAVLFRMVGPHRAVRNDGIPRFIDSPKNRLPWGDFGIRHGA